MGKEERDENSQILGAQASPTVRILGICLSGDAVQVVGAVLQVAGSLGDAKIWDLRGFS